MTEKGRVKIEKFDGQDFGFWKMQIEDILYQKDLYEALSEEKPDKMSDEDWKILDRKALGVVRLSLAKSVAFNIVNETTTYGLIKALSGMYEKPSALNKVYLIRQLVNTRMREGASVTVHINEFNSIITRLGSVGIKFDDEIQALLLLSSLPDSWSGTVTAVSSSSGTVKLTFEGIRDMILGEDIRRRSSGDSSNSLLSAEGRGRRNERGNGQGRRRSKSKNPKEVVCWDCKEVGHFRNQCPGVQKGKDVKKEKEMNNVADDEDSDDALICSVESSADSWVMDSGSSFHATHSTKAMKNLKIGNFGKVRLANDDILDVTGMGDIDLKTSVGATWTLKNVRVIPSLKRMLISVGQLDNQGLDVKFGGGQWKVVKGSLVIARGKKKGSLYMVEIPPEGASPVLVKDKIRFSESRVQKRVTFAKEAPRARVKIQNERLARKSSVKPVSVGGCRNSGSTGKNRVSVAVPVQQWVKRTSIPSVKVSPDVCLLGLESGGSQFVSDASRVTVELQCERAEIRKNESLAGLVVTDELKLGVASTGLQGN